ncbi:hypothetical protein [Methanocrinis sp.]|uniref:hypothetical protein n=1 Tax=Methanocrinis sp. TaxID=3101522 RepID=UPI003D124569
MRITLAIRNEKAETVARHETPDLCGLALQRRPADLEVDLEIAMMITPHSLAPVYDSI